MMRFVHPAPPGQRLPGGRAQTWPTVGVGHRKEQQPAEQTKIFQEIHALAATLTGLVAVAERLPGDPGRDQRGG